MLKKGGDANAVGNHRSTGGCRTRHPFSRGVRLVHKY
jgi:hypothetical protein